MPRTRRGPALFELMGQEAVRVVGAPKARRWWSSLRGPSESRAASIPAPPPQSSDVDAPPLTLHRSGAEPLFAIEGDRVRLSLTPASAAVGIFVVLTVLVAAYVVGVRTGDRAGFRRGYDRASAREPGGAVDEIQAARNRPPATHLIAPLLTEPGVAAAAPSAPKRDPAVGKAAEAAPAAKTGWVRDLTYIVVQEFPAGAVDKAQDAQRFLAQRGVDAEVVTLSSGGVHLMTRQGHHHKDPAQKQLAEQLLAKVRTIGSQYYAAGGGYRLEGYYKTLKRDHW